MRILGLDPGSRHTGYGVLEREGERLVMLACGRFSCSPRQPLAERLWSLSRQLNEAVERWRPDVAALETPFHGLNARSLVVLAEARGALLAVLASHRLAIHEYTPAQVKSAVAGNGRAGKEEVARMVGFHLDTRTAGASADATDALAVGICYAHRHRLDRLISKDDE